MPSPSFMACCASFPAVLDAAPALNRLCDDERLYVSLLRSVIETNLETPQTLASLLATGQATKAVAIAHALSGAAGNLGLVQVHKQTQAIVQHLRRSSILPAQSLGALAAALKDAAAVLSVVQDSAPSSAAPAALSKEPLPEPPPLSDLLRALRAREFASVEFYSRCRPFLAISYPEDVARLDLEMDLLNFKAAESILASCMESLE